MEDLLVHLLIDDVPAADGGHRDSAFAQRQASKRLGRRQSDTVEAEGTGVAHPVGHGLLGPLQGRREWDTSKPEILKLREIRQLAEHEGVHPLVRCCIDPCSPWSRDVPVDDAGREAATETEPIEEGESPRVLGAVARRQSLRLATEVAPVKEPVGDLRPSRSPCRTPTPLNSYTTP